MDVDSGVMRARSFRWFTARVVGLLVADTRLARALGYAPPLGTVNIRTQ